MEDYWKTVTVSFLGFISVITALTVLNNLEILSGSFCGSLGDFTNGAAPEVCISFWEYWGRAAVHWPYTLTAAIIGVGTGWSFRELQNR